MNSNTGIPEMGASTLAKVIQTRITTSVQNAFSENLGLIKVYGKLGTVRLGNYPKAYGVKLSERGEEVLLDIPKELVSRLQLRGGETVMALGMLTAQCGRFSDHRLAVHLDVTDMVTADGPEATETEKSDQMTLARLKGLGVRRQPFPLHEAIKVSVVLSRSGQALVDQDFLQELAPIEGQVEIEKIPVNILSAEDIAAGIRRASGNVVAVIRGGGNEDQFDVFENAQVIEALANKKAYRVIGLGHTANTTLLDLLADYAANTPTRAGAHIREMVEHNSRAVVDLNRQLAAQQKVAREAQEALLKARSGEEVATRLVAERDGTIRGLQADLEKRQSGEGKGGYSSLALGLAFAAGVLSIVAYIKFFG